MVNIDDTIKKVDNINFEKVFANKVDYEKIGLDNEVVIRRLNLVHIRNYTVDWPVVDDFEENKDDVHKNLVNVQGL